MRGAWGLGPLAMGVMALVAGLSVSGVASAQTSLARVSIDQSSLNIAAIGPSHNPFGPLQSGQTIAEVFTTAQPFDLVGAYTPTWTTKQSGATLILRDGAGLTGTVVTQHVFTDVADGSNLSLVLTSPAPAGTYTLELADPTGPAPIGSATGTGSAIGWWGSNEMVSGDYALVNGQQQQDELVLEYQPVATAASASTTASSGTAASSTTASTASASSTSVPKTGEGPVLPLAGLMALAAGVGLVYRRRRQRA